MTEKHVLDLEPVRMLETSSFDAGFWQDRGRTGDPLMKSLFLVPCWHFVQISTGQKQRAAFKGWHYLCRRCFRLLGDVQLRHKDGAVPIDGCHDGIIFAPVNNT